MSGRLANPTQNTGYEPNLYRCINEEHTPINPPDSFQCRDDATIISAAEDPEVPYPGASSSSKQTAASKVSTMSESSGVSLCKQRPESVDSRARLMWTENMLLQPFSLLSQKGREIEIKTSCIPREREHLQIILERKVDSAVRGERKAQQKLCEGEAEVEARNLEKC